MKTTAIGSRKAAWCTVEGVVATHHHGALPNTVRIVEFLGPANLAQLGTAQLAGLARLCCLMALLPEDGASGKQEVVLSCL